MGSVQGDAHDPGWGELGGKGPYDAAQRKYGTGLDLTGLCAHASNNCPSKPFSHLYSKYFLTVTGKKRYMSVMCRLKNKP